MMTAEEVILAILRTLPEHRVTGKKRLQKLVYLLSNTGISGPSDFHIRNFGPFSKEVERASTLLALFGDIEENEVETGYARYLTTEYKLSDLSKSDLDIISEEQKSILLALDDFTTIELEVASTILFFEKEGCDHATAIERTALIKPTKVNTNTLAASEKILGYFC